MCVFVVSSAAQNMIICVLVCTLKYIQTSINSYKLNAVASAATTVRRPADSVDYQNYLQPIDRATDTIFLANKKSDNNTSIHTLTHTHTHTRIYSHKSLSLICIAASRLRCGSTFALTICNTQLATRIRHVAPLMGGHADCCLRQFA